MSGSTAGVAFLDVDTQVDFMEPGGKLYAPGAEAIKGNLARLVGFARAAGIPLVASVDAHGEGDAEFAEFPPHCIVGTPGQLKVAETRGEGMTLVPSAPGALLPDPRATWTVLEKQRFSLFSNPNAEPLLARTGARIFCVFGVVTEVCVRQAVEGLLERGYAVEVVEDAVWPIDPDDGRRALEAMRARGAVGVTTDELLGRLS